MATDVACAALNGLKMGDKTLTVRRATMRLVFSNKLDGKKDKFSLTIAVLCPNFCWLISYYFLACYHFVSQLVCAGTLV